VEGSSYSCEELHIKGTFINAGSIISRRKTVFGGATSRILMGEYDSEEETDKLESKQETESKHENESKQE